MMSSHPSRGFTLVELMIAVAILAIVSAIAVPLYSNYVREGRLGAMRMNLSSLRIALEDHRIEDANNRYAPNPGPGSYTGQTVGGVFSWNPGNPAIAWQGWRPEGDGGRYLYTVTQQSNWLSFDVSATDTAANVTLTCTNRMSNCTP
jgi:prepilin-type N-terminal cleavage/methylation domain-containing protein